MDFIIINQELQIPEAELTFRFSTSSGPGGQHVNRSETRVTLLFDVAHSPSLTEEQRTRLLLKLQARLDGAGVLQISVQDSRSQHRNRDTAVTRLQHILAEALKEPKRRHKTRPSRTAVEKRLESKKRQSVKKQQRRSEW
jgi:ribosome-associated protein